VTLLLMYFAILFHPERTSFMAASYRRIQNYYHFAAY
jgi:hypothetical protein